MTLPLEGNRLPHMCTHTGKFLDLMDFKETDVNLEDIAHGLACVNRFGGQAREPISVAQHSVFVSRLCDDTPFALQALLHDASEAYLGDVIFMLKRAPEMIEFRKLEQHVQHTIYRAFGCEVDDAPEVVNADKLMVEFEAKYGFKPGCFRFDMPGYSFPDAQQDSMVGGWEPWSWREAESVFLARYSHLVCRKYHIEDRLLPSGHPRSL